MYRNRIIILFFFMAKITLAQELICKVNINSEQVQISDRSIFTDMEQAFTNFMNTRKWTTDTYENHEKISATLFLNITDMPSVSHFIARAQITSARPIYNTTYQTVLLNFADRNWDFEYFKSLPLNYNDNTYSDNLTSLLAFYAYIILGMDYDSFSDMGGNPYFQKALTVVTNAQLSGNPGWAALESNRNRYALVENLTNPQMTVLRKNTYRYHRLTLDNFSKNPDQGRAIALDILKNTLDLWRVYPSSIFIISFLDAKSSEIIDIFSGGTLQIRQEAYDILSTIDPKRSTYNKLISN